MANRIKQERNFPALCVSFEEKATTMNRADLEVLKQGFLPMHLNKPYSGEKYYAAILAFAMAPSIESAIDAMCLGANLRHPEAANIIMDAINNAPEAWLKKHNEDLFQKGVIRGAKYYHMVHVLHQAGSDMDKATMKIPLERKPLLDLAIDAAYKRGLESIPNITDRALVSIAIQLMDDSPEKIELAHKVDKEFGPNGIAWQKSIEALVDIAHAANFNVANLPKPLNPRNKKKPAPIVAAVEKVRPSEEQNGLKSQLDLLAGQNKIKKTDVPIGFYMCTPLAGNVLPTDMHVVSKFSMKWDDVQDLKAKLQPILTPIQQQLKAKRDAAGAAPIEP